MLKNYKMSLSVAPVPILCTDDPRVDLNVEPFYLVERGASEVLYRHYPADSFSGGTININATISDRRTVIDSKISVRAKLKVVATSNIAGTFVAGAAGATPGIEENIRRGLICPRYSPLMSACTNASLMFNSKQFNQPVSRYNTPLMKYCTSNDEAAYDFSTFPSYQDVLSEFYNFSGTPAYVANQPTPNNNELLSAMGSIKDCDAYSASKRMAWLQNVAKSSDTATDTELTFEFETEEILSLSPLIWGHKQVKGISGIDTLSIYLNYDSGLLNASMQYCPSTNGAGTAKNITFAVTVEACSAEFIFLTPRADMQIPPVLRYRYNNIQYVAKNMAGVDVTNSFYNRFSKVGPTFTGLMSDSITLQGLPKRMYIFVKRQQDKIKSNTPDTYARITKVNLMLGNKPGILSEAEPQALYKMSVKNGYQGSWDNWYNNCGSVICIDFAQDIPLNLLDAPGTLSKMNLQYSVDGTSLYYDYNTDAVAAPGGAYYYTPLELNTVLVYDGIVVIKDGQVIQEQNDVSPLDVVNGTKINHVYYHDIIDYAGGNYAGGAISKYVDAVKRGFGKVRELANKAAPYVKEYGPKVLSAAEKAIPIIASVLAAGYTENEIYAIMDRYAKAEKKKPVKGGARAGKAALKARAIKM